MRKEDIVIRDPFVLTLKEGYLMTGTTHIPGKKQGIYGYLSKELENFDDPILLFDPPKGFWGDRDFWAPEIHEYEGQYYMFVSFRSLYRRRATQILVSDKPEGPYKVMENGPLTPEKWHCLDGSLFIDENGAPWMVYVREFVQMVDGEMYAQRLSKDLRKTIGDPVNLFSATWAPWCVTNEEGGMPFEQPGGYITDGPFIFQLPDGSLGMLWSSFCKTGYCQAVCYSPTGKITGPWKQMDEPLYEHNSGHGMLFKDHDGNLRLALHDHNNTQASHPVFLKALLKSNRLEIIE